MVRKKNKPFSKLPRSRQRELRSQWARKGWRNQERTALGKHLKKIARRGQAGIEVIFHWVSGQAITSPPCSLVFGVPAAAVKGRKRLNDDDLYDYAKGEAIKKLEAEGHRDLKITTVHRKPVSVNKRKLKKLTDKERGELPEYRYDEKMNRLDGSTQGRKLKAKEKARDRGEDVYEL